MRWQRAPGRVALAIVCLTAVAVGPAQPAPDAPSKQPVFWPPPVLSRERAVDATVRLDSRGGGAFDSGTGVGVGAHVVLTNAHLTRNNVTLVTRCGDELLAVDRIVLADDGTDVAVVVTTGPGLLPIELAAEDPEPGDAVLIAGYPGGELTLVDGRVKAVTDFAGGAVITFSPEPARGQSGSPLLDADGRLAGLAFAQETTGGQGLAIPASRLRVLLDEFRADGVPIADPIIGDPSAAPARSSRCR